MKHENRAQAAIIATVVVVIVIVAAVAYYFLTKPPPEEVKLHIWTPEAEELTKQDWMSLVISEFEEQYPNVEIVATHMADEDFKIGLKTSLAAGTPPDIWLSWGGGVLKAYTEAEVVMDLTEVLNELGPERVPEALLGSSTFNGKHWALPYSVWIGHIYINLDLFEEAGVEVPPDDQWTWDEFKDAINTFKANDIIPISVAGAETWELSFYYMYLVDRIGGSELYTNAISRVPGYTFEDPAFVEAGAKIQELAELGAFQEGFLGAGYTDAYRLFADDQAAMHLMGTWVVGGIFADNPDFALDAIKFPTIPGGAGDPSMLLGAVQNHWCISEVSEHKEEAAEFLKLMAEEESILQFVEITGDIPCLPADIPSGSFFSVIEKQMAHMGEASWLQMAYDQYSPPEFASVHLDVMAELFAGTITPEEAATMQEEVAQTL